MTTFIVDLDISADELLTLYRGEASTVLARARDGRVIQFPAGRLRRFVQNDGVHGSFALSIDGDNRLTSIKRI